MSDVKINKIFIVKRGDVPVCLSNESDKMHSELLKIVAQAGNYDVYSRCPLCNSSYRMALRLIFAKSRNQTHESLSES